MNKKWKILHPLVMLLVGLILTTGAGYAQEETPVMEQINLSVQQRDQIKSLREQFVRETEQVRNDIRRLKDEEKIIRARTPPNESALRKKMMERADKEIEIALALTRFNQRVDAVLTPAQRAKLAQLKAQSAREQTRKHE